MLPARLKFLLKTLLRFDLLLLLLGFFLFFNRLSSKCCFMFLMDLTGWRRPRAHACRDFAAVTMVPLKTPQQRARRAGEAARLRCVRARWAGSGACCEGNCAQPGYTCSTSLLCVFINNSNSTQLRFWIQQQWQVQTESNQAVCQISHLGILKHSAATSQNIISG